MFASERMNYICEMLKKNGAVTTAQISNELDVSVETVRRDLLTLEREHRLMRVHGGAVSCGTMIPNKPLSDRLESNLDKKHSLSKVACKFVNENDTVTIDAGSTGLEFAKTLAETFTHLTVITHSLDVFNFLKQGSTFELILIGGRFSTEENCFIGYLAENSYKRLHLGKSFVMPAALSIKSGLCHSNEQFVPLQNVMIDNADSVFVLADSDKFEKNALFSSHPLDMNYTYITDSNISDELVNLYGESGLKIFTEKKASE